jgi:Icc-related predicted phosphoesterase
MKLHILSDLHIEFAGFKPRETDADVVILAGDIHVGEKGFVWAEKQFKNQQVIYVLGNHEYYHGEIPGLTQNLITRSQGTNIHILENKSLTIGDVQFSGCTLWTDFKLLNNPDTAMVESREKVNDYRMINLSGEQKKIDPSYTATCHSRSRSWLNQELKKAQKEKKKTVVITHCAPGIMSVPDRYKNDVLSAAFASRMEGFIEKTQPDLWVHGHIHDSSDYNIGKTRILCNPRGYEPNEPNTDFNPDLFVEI